MSSKGLLPAEAETLFGEADWGVIENLFDRFSESQLRWLSGYLAGSMPRQESARAPEEAPDSLLIAFASETGNCRTLARRLFELAGQRGIRARLADLAQAKARQLAKESFLLLICSTHGEGDPPETAARFHEELSAIPPGSFKRLKYAVLALGDSSYDRFCQTGKDMDRFLEAAGATRLAPRQDCDVDYEQAARAWMESALALVGKAAPAQAPAKGPRLVRSAPAPAVPDKHHPCEVEVLGSTLLSHSSRQGGIWHVELAGGARMEIQPGDAIGILPLNDAALVDEILDLGGMKGEAEVRLGERALSLREALGRHADLVIPAKGLLDKWAQWNPSGELQDLCQSDSLTQRLFLKSVQIRDLLQWFPAAPAPQDFVEQLRPLQPRLYDIANYEGDRPEELHLTVEQYQYWINRRRENGTASHFLSRLEPGEKVRIFPHSSQRFHLPDDHRLPLVLIAVGTGIAPYRAFVQKLRQMPSPPPCWIVFQEMRYEEDFLYQLEWQEALRENAVTAFDGVFVNDDPSRTLAQTVLSQHARLEEWLEQGAHVYLSGERKALLECEASLSAFLERASPPAKRWKELAKQGRIHKNLY